MDWRCSSAATSLGLGIVAAAWEKAWMSRDSTAYKQALQDHQFAPIPGVSTPHHFMKFPFPPPPTLLKPKCSQDSLCSFGSGCETGLKIPMGCVVVLACCWCGSAKCKAVEGNGRYWQFIAAKVEENALKKRQFPSFRASSPPNCEILPQTNGGVRIPKIVRYKKSLL